jgi:hypothetical protein
MSEPVKASDIDKLNRPIWPGFTLKDCARRAGSLEILASPSRIEGTLFYPDGRVVKP